MKRSFLAAGGCTMLLFISVAAAAPRPAARRVTIFSDNFERDFPGGWERKGNLPANASLFDGTPKSGAHSVRHLGSPVTSGKDCDTVIERIVSTVGYTDIEVAFYMGASGMDSATELAQFNWAEQGFFSANKYWHETRNIKGGDPENDGALHHFTYSLSPAANDNSKLTIWFGLRGTDSADDLGYLDDVVVTGRNAGGSRVTLFSDDFEGDFPGSWTRKGNVPANAALFSGAPRRGEHSLQFMGSPSTFARDCDSAMQRVISTAGYHNIQVSFRMGASNLGGATEAIEASWASDGVYAANQYWHVLKRVQGGDADQDGNLHQYTISLPAEADNNPRFVLWFGSWGLKAANQGGYIDDVVVSGE